MNLSRVLPTRPAMRGAGPLLLAAAVCAATAMLVWQGYRATEQSKRSVRLLLEGRAAEQLSLLRAGLVEDMKGAHATVLVPLTPGQLVLDPPYDFSRTPSPAPSRGFLIPNPSLRGRIRAMAPVRVSVQPGRSSASLATKRPGCWALSG